MNLLLIDTFSSPGYNYEPGILQKNTGNNS